MGRSLGVALTGALLHVYTCSDMECTYITKFYCS